MDIVSSIGSSVGIDYPDYDAMVNRTNELIDEYENHKQQITIQRIALVAIAVLAIALIAAPIVIAFVVKAFPIAFLSLALLSVPSFVILIKKIRKFVADTFSGASTRDIEGYVDRNTYDVNEQTLRFLQDYGQYKTDLSLRWKYFGERKTIDSAWEDIVTHLTDEDLKNVANQIYSQTIQNGESTIVIRLNRSVIGQTWIRNFNSYSEQYSNASSKQEKAAIIERLKTGDLSRDLEGIFKQDQRFIVPEDVLRIINCCPNLEDITFQEVPNDDILQAVIQHKKVKTVEFATRYAMIFNSDFLEHFERPLMLLSNKYVRKS